MRVIVGLGVLGLVASVACSRSEPPRPVDADARSAAPPDATAPSAADARSAAPPSAADRAAAIAALGEGRKLSRAKDWSKALEAFDRALAVMADDPRILSEVGWAAFQANRLDRAEQANARALANTKEPLVRAPILYNVGRVAEARNRPDAARKAYRESLALRTNKEVKRRLDALGTADTSTEPVPDGLGCKQGFPDVAALCRCLKEEGKDDLFVPTSSKFKCGRVGTSSLGDGRFGVVEAGGEELGEVAHLLVVNEAGRVRWLRSLGSDYEPGAFGVHNQASVIGGETRNVAGHTIVIVHSAQDDNDFNMAGLELCEYHAKLDTVCAIGEGAGETRCTLPIPVEARSGCGPGVTPDPKEMDDDLRETLAELKKNATSSSVKAEWTIGADGKVAVTVVSGTSDLISVAAKDPAPLWK
ncbi:MAG: tetratricopeptide repeat protein [Labilithrix sp.]